MSDPCQTCGGSGKVATFIESLSRAKIEDGKIYEYSLESGEYSPLPSAKIEDDKIYEYSLESGEYSPLPSAKIVDGRVKT